MIKKIVARSTIARLNAISRTNVKSGMHVLAAMEAAAQQLGFTEFRRDDSTILFRNKQRSFVNCWIEGPMSQNIEPGGAGFDDQINWSVIPSR
jgi:hypothetical protein